MFNPRQYGIAQGSLIAKSIHQEDLQCNESSVRGRRKALPPRIASAAPKTFFSPGRGGRGAGRGGKGVVRGRGGGVGHFASSRAFHMSRPQAPNSSYTSASSAPKMMPSGPMFQAVSGITNNAGPTLSHHRGPHRIPTQPRSWKGKAVMPAPDDENPRPAKRQRMDCISPILGPSYPQGSHFPSDDRGGLSTPPASANNIVSTPVKDSKRASPPAISPIVPLQSPLGRSQRIYLQRRDRLPPHIATHLAVPTVNNGLSTTPAWLPRAMKQKRGFYQNEQSRFADMLADLAPTELYDAKTPSFRNSVASSFLPAVKDTPSYRPPRAPAAMDQRSERPQSLQLNDTKVHALCTSTTDTLPPRASNATPRSFQRPPPVPKAKMATYNGPWRQLKSTQSSPSIAASLLPRSSDVHQIASTLTTDVKKEFPPSLTIPMESPVPSPPAKIKLENVDSSLTENHCGSVDANDPIIIKQEPDPSESIIPQRKLVTESCSFYPIPQNCRKSMPNYKNNRIEYFRREYKRLREFGLTKQKVIFRDDGLAIEWTSPIPVWSDTLLPEANIGMMLKNTYREVPSCPSGSHR